MYQRFRTGMTALTFVFLTVAMAQAHFLWVTIDGEPGHCEGKLFFSEAGDVPGVKLPESIEAAQVLMKKENGDPQVITLERFEKDGDIWMAADVDSNEPVCLQTSCQYGLYHGVLLHYFAKAIQLSVDYPNPIVATDEQLLDLQPAWTAESLKVRLTWKGTAVDGAELNIITPDANEHDLKSDEHGWVTLPMADPGLYSVRANRDEESPGELDGKKYKRISYYSTLTFRVPGKPVERTAAEKASVSMSDQPQLPEGLASFGAAVSEDWLYVYGGHIGRAHAHSKDNLSQHFRRFNLNDGTAWESLPMQTPLQGLPLVAHGGYLYRIGGLSALNAPGEEDDLHSVDEVQRFDPAGKTWTKLPSLPAPRSSHDAVVVGDKIYVAGGWTLAGDGDGEWCETALVMDLSHEQPAWEAFKVPFQRRALALGERDGKIFAIGGIDEFGDVDRSVDVYDPATGQWSSGPVLPGDGMQGFGVSAWQPKGDLFVSGSDGQLYRLNPAGDAWIAHGELREPRFFHRLLPFGDLRLVAVGGASMKGHLTDIGHIVCAGSEN